MSERVLVVDDEPSVRLAITGFLEPQGFLMEQASSVEGARKALARNRFDAAILDYVLPDGNALELMKEMLEVDPNLAVILLTGHGSIELAVKAMREGAENFLTKPIELDALEVVLERALEGRRIRKQYLAARGARDDETRGQVDPFIGESRAIRDLERQAGLALKTDSPILIEGETGSGKGVLASWIHRHGPRSAQPLVDLNCAGLSAELLESELFGHARGAFTGAVADKKGLLEIADRGVLFLDEIGDTEPVIQAKLLKAVEEQSFRKLGAVRDQRVDVQLLAATHRDLRDLCDRGEFRPDLYFRISTLVLRLPPLRNRREDLPLLSHALLEKMAQKRGEAPPLLSAEALERLATYSWPGNIRELRNVLERALLTCDDTEIHPRHLHWDWTADQASNNPREGETLKAAERQQIERALSTSRGVITEAAEALGISRSTLYNKARSFGIDIDKYRS